MKLKIVLTGLIFTLGMTVFGQGKRVEAYYALKNAKTAMMQQNVDKAFEEIVEAKGYIDETYNISTEKFTGSKDPKTLYYKGEIYFLHTQLKAMKEMQDGKSQEEIGQDPETEKMMKEAVEAYKGHLAIENKKSKENYDKEIKQKFLAFAGIVGQQAGQSYSDGNYEDAVENYSAAIELYAIGGYTDSVAYYNGGNAAFSGEMYDTTAKYMEKCRSINFGGHLPYWRGAEAEFKIGNNEKGLAILQEGKKKYPKEPNMYIVESNYYREAGENDKAAAALEALIALNDKDDAIISVVGSTYDDLGEVDKAYEYYNMALEINPTNQDALYNKGVNRYNKGVEIFNKANDIASDAMAKEEKEKAKVFFNEALVPLQKLHEIAPDDSATIQMMMKVYARLGDNDKYNEMKALLSN
jgi:tetratricopeptide (TPR) repeat protein